MMKKLVDADLPRPEVARTEPITVMEQKNESRSPGGKFLKQNVLWVGDSSGGQKVFRAIESSSWREVCWTELTVTEDDRQSVID